ncbi:MAG: RCC1 domain-containing protein [Gemmatimonadales bacterium]
MSRRGRNETAAMALLLAVFGCEKSATAPAPSVIGSVSAGLTHTCALTTDGSAFCWGGNRYGQLGTGSSDTLAHPMPARVAGGLRFSTISAGERHTCALTIAGSAWCWGNGSSGALGTGDTLTRMTPTAVAGGIAFASISAGAGGVGVGAHTCALTAGGVAYCWGNGVYGQLGGGTNTSSVAPAAVSGGLMFTSVSAGETHTCGVAGGAAYCWGFNAHGALGAGAPSSSVYAPSPVSGGLSFATVRAGFRYTCALTAVGAAYCWGLNQYGQIGALTPNSCLGFSDDVFPCSVTPLAVQGAPAMASVFAGSVHTCALTPGGQAYCWGANESGQLGDGTITQQRPAPASVPGGLVFNQLTLGGHHTCGLTTGGAMYCWGDNSSGQLGDGSTNGRSVPMPVALAP